MESQDLLRINSKIEKPFAAHGVHPKPILDVGSGESDTVNDLIEITPNSHEESKLDSIQDDSPQVSMSGKWNISKLIDYLDPYPLDICIVSEFPINPLYNMIEVRVKKRVIEKEYHRYENTRRTVFKIIDEIPK